MRIAAVGLGEADKRIRPPEVKPPFLGLENYHLHAVGGCQRPELAADKLAFSATVVLHRITIQGDADEELVGEFLPQGSGRLAGSRGGWQPSLLTMHRKAKHQPEQGAYRVQLKKIKLHRNGSSMQQSRTGGKGQRWGTEATPEQRRSASIVARKLQGKYSVNEKNGVPAETSAP